MRSLFVVSSLVAVGLVVGCSAEQFTGTPTPPSPPSPDAGEFGGGGGSDAGDGGAQTDSGIDVAVPPGCVASRLPSEDACVITEASGVFVSPTGSASGDGSRAKPLASIGAAITAAKAAKKRVYACAGSYSESVGLANGVSMFGGFDCSTWAWSAAGRAIIASPTSPALKADGIDQPTRVEGFDVVAPAGNANAPSSIGMTASGSPAVVFVHGSIASGSGFAGAAGADAVQLQNGASANGEENVADAKCTGSLASVCIGWHTSRAGGINTCVGKGGYFGGAGGSAGSGGSWYDNGFQWGLNTPTSPGGPSVATSTTAAGGTGASAAQAGAVGATGSSGVNGTNLGTISINGYVPSDGTNGTDGAGGQGGGGGAGYGIPNSRLNAYTQGTLVYGIPGSGGGAGGCPGLAGAAGRGGGASIALVVVDSPMRFDDVKLVAADGGAGGAAGASTLGTAGGAAGADVSGSGVNLTNFLGAAGGAGGNGGLSGQGGGGPSISYAVHGTAPTFLGCTFTNGNGGAGAPQKSVPAGLLPASPNGFAGKTTSF